MLVRTESVQFVRVRISPSVKFAAVVVIVVLLFLRLGCVWLFRCSRLLLLCESVACAEASDDHVEVMIQKEQAFLSRSSTRPGSVVITSQRSFSFSLWCVCVRTSGLEHCLFGLYLSRNSPGVPDAEILGYEASTMTFLVFFFQPRPATNQLVL